MDTYRDLEIKTKINPLLIYYAIIELFKLKYGNAQQPKQAMLSEVVEQPLIYIMQRLASKNIKFTNPYDLEKSHYLKGEPIQMVLNDGTIKHGTIRLSNHQVNLSTFCKNNNYDFAISIVIGKEEAYYDDVSTDLEREIHIAQYVVDSFKKNSKGIKMYGERQLENIINEIEKIITNGYNFANNFAMFKQEFEEIKNPEVDNKRF